MVSPAVTFATIVELVVFVPGPVVAIVVHGISCC